MAVWINGAALQLQVKPAGIAVGPEYGLVLVRWQLANPMMAPLELLESWLPHGRFFAVREAFEPAIILPPGASDIVDRMVRCDAEPGEVIENAFLILRVRICGQPWRVLTRLRLECLAPGSATLSVETVTTQPIGFSQPTAAEVPKET